MRIASGVTDQYIYFVAVDATDLKTRETGLATWTVYRSRNGGASAAFTTPTINETDATNLPGVYELLLDEDMTIDAGDETQEMVFHITHAGMAPVTRTIELFRPKITAGNTLDVTATGAAGIDWGNVENPTTSVNLSATTTNLVNTVTTYTGNTVQTGDAYARLGAPAGASVSADVADVKAKTDNLPSDPADASVIAGRFDTLDTSVADLPTNAELATALGTADDAVLAQVALVKAKTDLIPSDPADASDIATLIDALPTAAENATAVLTTAMTESYAADGAAPTLAQAIFLTMQSLSEFSIAGTTITVKKLDGSTTAAAFTMDSATVPTSRTRAS